MGIRAVIWDMGGVLVRTEDQTPRQQLAERLGVSLDELYHLVFGSERALQTSLGKKTTRQHWSEVGQALGLSSPEEISGIERDFFAGDRIDMELVDYIRGLRPRYKTGLLSNAYDDLRHMLERVWGIADAFDDLVISAEVGVVKPDPAIYRLALERLGVRPGEAVFVDDFARNVAAAQAEKMHAIHFQNPAQARQELEQLLQASDAQ
ncbi:MAG: HAD family phosphatase [Chloroflexota bacterium]